MRRNTGFLILGFFLACKGDSAAENLDQSVAAQIDEHEGSHSTGPLQRIDSGGPRRQGGHQ